MKKTAVELLVEQVFGKNTNYYLQWKLEIEQALKVEKDNIEDSFEYGWSSRNADSMKSGKQYYLETFKSAKTTVNELFQWYIGGDWKEDWQVTNTMLVDGEHAQTGEDRNGELTLERLVSLADKEVEVINEVDSFDRIWEISFTLEGKKYVMQATTFFPDEEDGY